LVNRHAGKNKGEWSELYAFLRLLDTGKLYTSDMNLNAIPSSFVSIIKAVRDDVSYFRSDSDVKIISTANGFSVPLIQFKENADALLRKIKNNRGSQGFPEMEPFFSSIKISKVKARSSKKGDISIKIHDSKTGLEPEVEYSIKSYIGGKPTLLNASEQTAIHYTLSGLSKNQIAAINGIQPGRKIIDRITAIKDAGARIEFHRFESAVFTRNLMMIDSLMPELLAYLFLESYYVKGKRLSDVVASYVEKNPEKDRDLIAYKIKNLLVNSALGMTPGTEWTGLDEANGGFITVKEDGEIVCFQIYDRNNLKEYLYRHTKFDTPSSARTGLGEIYDEDGKIGFKLTLHIRFI
jgi:hypothetical protein